MESDTSPISRKETIAAVFELEFYRTEDGKEEKIGSDVTCKVLKT